MTVRIRFFISQVPCTWILGVPCSGYIGLNIRSFSKGGKQELGRFNIGFALSGDGGDVPDDETDFLCVDEHNLWETINFSYELYQNDEFAIFDALSTDSTCRSWPFFFTGRSTSSSSCIDNMSVIRLTQGWRGWWEILFGCKSFVRWSLLWRYMDSSLLGKVIASVTEE